MTAYATAVDRIHAPAFLQKLAARGYAASTQEEALSLIEMGFKLARANPAGLQKQPAAPLNKYAGAVQGLDYVLGLSVARGDASMTEMAKQAMLDPQLYAAVSELVAAA